MSGVVPAKKTTQPGRHNPWTSKEVAQLREFAHLGAAGVAELLDRPLWSVKGAARRHRISLRQPGNRDGLVLGQPRGVSFLEARLAGADVRALRKVRSGILDGSIRPEDAERALRRERLLARGIPLCPSCARNPQEQESSGLCLECHLHRLAEGHRLGQRLQEARRDLWRARQEKSRRMRREATA